MYEVRSSRLHDGLNVRILGAGTLLQLLTWGGETPEGLTWGSGSSKYS